MRLGLLKGPPKNYEYRPTYGLANALLLQKALSPAPRAIVNCAARHGHYSRATAHGHPNIIPIGPQTVWQMQFCKLLSHWLLRRAEEAVAPKRLSRRNSRCAEKAVARKSVNGLCRGDTAPRQSLLHLDLYSTSMILFAMPCYRQCLMLT